MKLLYEPLDITLDFNHYEIIELVIEDKDYFAKMLFELYESFEGCEGVWILSRDDNVVSLDKNSYTINDYYFMPNPSKSRTVSSALLKQVTTLAEGSEHFEESQALASKVEQYCLMLVEDLAYDFEVSADEGFSISSLVKAMGLRIYLNSDDLVSRIIEFLDLMETLSGINLFILVNVGAFMGSENLKALNKEACYHNHKLLLLSSTSTDCDLSKRIIVDANLAVI